MMKKLILVLSLIVGISLPSFASTNKVESLFNAHEKSLTLSSGYVYDGCDLFGADYQNNVTAGVAYFPTKVLGVEGRVPFYQSEGVSVTEAQAGVLFRVPFHHFAPYVGLGAAYNWNEVVDISYIAKGGLEYRFNKGWGLFTEYQYRNNDSNWELGTSSVHAGVRFVF